uniref:Uncharacterized protein n=2 Tax=Oryza TaxID=4527 RepID=A0A0E0QX04_ORYRU
MPRGCWTAGPHQRQPLLRKKLRELRHRCQEGSLRDIVFCMRADLLRNLGNTCNSKIRRFCTNLNLYYASMFLFQNAGRFNTQIFERRPKLAKQRGMDTSVKEGGSLLAALDQPCLQSFAVMPVLEGHAVVPHVHRLRTWLSAASGCGLLRDVAVGRVAMRQMNGLKQQYV